MVDPAPAVPEAAEPPQHARKMALADAVSEIVLRRQMLDRDMGGERFPAPAGRLSDPVLLYPRMPAGESLRDEQLKTLAADAETLKAQGNGYSAMSEVAAELQRLREEIRRDSMPKSDPRFEEMRTAFDELRVMIEARESQELVGTELSRIADGLAQLTEEGADRSTLNTLRAELEAMRGLFGQMARETSLQAETEIEVKRDIKDELQRLRESLRSLASEDQVKAVEKRWSEFEERYVASPAAPDESAISRLLQTELESVRDQIEALSDKAPMEAVEKRWDALEERLDTRQMETTIQRLSERMGDLEQQLSGLPNNQAISALEDRMRTLAQGVEAIALNNPGPDLEQFVMIEDRLDEISRAIVATSLQQPAIDMAPIERIEARIATLAARIDVTASNGETEMLAERLAELSAQVQTLSTDASSAQIAERVAELSAQVQTLSTDASSAQIAERVAELSAKVETLSTDASSAQIAERVAELSAKVETLSTDTSSAQIAERMAELAGRFEAAFAELEAPQLDTSAIEARLSALTDRLEENAVPHFDPAVVQALEAQIARLAAGLERPERLQVEPDPEIDRRLAAIEHRLDEQRDALIAAAREIADDTAKRMQAIGDKRQGEHIAQLSENLKALETLSRENDERAGEVFENLHGTLMKIVDRLEQIEIDVGGRRVTETPLAEPALAGTALTVTPAAAGTKVAAKALISATPGTPLAAELSTPVFLRTGEVSVAQKPAAREAVSAPSLDASDMIERKEVNRPLEPGSGAPDIGVLLERLQLQRGGKGASTREPMGDAELVAAARRASRAAAAAVETEAKAVQASAGKGGASRMSSFVQRRRKPILIAVLAVIAALAALPLKEEFGPVIAAQLGSGQTDGGTTIEGTAAPVASAVAVETPAEPSMSSTAPVTVADAGLTHTVSARSEPAAASVVPAVVASAEPAPSAQPVASAEPVAKAEPAAAASSDADDQLPARRTVTTTDSAAILGRAEAKLPAGSLASIPAVPENIGTPALVSAATGGDAKALFEVGLRLMEGRNGESKPAEALVWFAQAAKRGFAPAQYSLGTLFEKGNGVQRDTGAARDWYLLAANQGNVRAMHNLAVLYATGVEGVSDPDTALGWFEKAADYGMRDSQYNLGILYARGSGTDQDLASSYKWFSIVAKTGDKDAEAKMQEIAKSLKPDQLKRAQDLVSGWTPKPRPEQANTVEIPPAWTAKSDTTASVDMKRAVRNIQAILGKLGYDAGTPDGVIGEKTKTAIVAFQKETGLQATGAVDEPLIRALLERKDG